MSWKWKYFTRKELSSKDDGSFVTNADALDKLERMRIIMAKPLIINSAYRSPIHNKKIGGKPNSMHVQGRAFDVSIKGHNPVALHQAAVEAGFTGFGFARTYLHVDTGAKRYWEYKKGDKRKFVTQDVELPVIALSIDKETEKPSRIDNVPLSTKQKAAVVTSTGVVATTGVVSVIPTEVMSDNAPAVLAFLQAIDYRFALVIIAVGLAGFVWWVLRVRK